MALNLNLKGEEASIPTTLTGLNQKEIVAYAVPTHACTTLEMATPVIPGVPTHATTLEVVNLRVDEMSTHATAQGVVNLKVEEILRHATAQEVVNLKVGEMRGHATALEVVNLKVGEMPTHATTLEVVPPMSLKLKGPALATTLECPDSNAAVCPTTTNSVKPSRTKPTTNTG